MAAHVRVVMHEEQLRALYQTTRSPVIQWVVRVGRRIENLARAMCPVDNGDLKRSITQEIRFEGQYVELRVGSNMFYALWVHDGTGLYGPRGQMIVPVNAKALRWPVHGRRPPTATVKGKRVGGSKTLQPVGFMFSMHSRGMKPRPYLKTALEKANIAAP